MAGLLLWFSRYLVYSLAYIGEAIVESRSIPLYLFLVFAGLLFPPLGIIFAFCVLSWAYVAVHGGA